MLEITSPGAGGALPPSASTRLNGTATRRFAAATVRGFTLIEVMITVAIICILAGVAMPLYKDYVTRSRLADAVTGLATMRAQMERYYQDNRTYASSGGFVSPCRTTSVTGRTFGDFVIECTGKLTDKEFTLQAKGTGPVSGFTYTINEKDVRATKELPPKWGSACGSKWITKKGDPC